MPSIVCKVALDPAGKSKGYGYVHFEKEEACAAAVKLNIEILGQKVEIQPFQKKQHASRSANWTNLYAKNVPTHLTDGDFEAMFREFGPIVSCKLMTYSDADVAKDNALPTPHGFKVGASKGFGFVNFAEHEHALAAAAALNGKLMADPEAGQRRDAAVAKALAEGKEVVKKAGEEDYKPGEVPMRPLFVARAQKADERSRELKKTFADLRERHHQSFLGVNIYVKNLDDEIDDAGLHTVRGVSTFFR